MRYMTIATVALLATTTVASADPVRLTDDQMDQVSAGVLDNLRLNFATLVGIQASAPITANTVAAVGILSEGVVATGETKVDSINAISFNNAADFGG